MDYQNTFWDRFTFVAGEPVREDRIRGVVTHVREDGDVNASSSDVADVFLVFSLDDLVELFGVLTLLGLHKFVVGQGLWVGAEVGGLDSEDSAGECST